MSRRRVSVKDLGSVDCQGWLHRRKEGRSFLSSRWKRFWFVLKDSSLYWYHDPAAEKAEGFINLSGFTIETAKHSRRKHAFTATHLVVTVYVAAQTFTDMNRWISKLSEAAEATASMDSEECYSENSDEDGEDSGSTSCPLDSDPSQHTPPTLSPGGDRRRCSSDAGTLGGMRRRRSGPEEHGQCLSWLDVAGGGGHLPLLSTTEEEEEEEKDIIQEKTADEMESLYKHLKAARLSLIGQSSQRDFKASFIRRCSNDKVNEKLHLLRILRSTLKAKELELLAVDQVLSDSSLSALSYRQWRLHNVIILQESTPHRQTAGGAAQCSDVLQSVCAEAEPEPEAEPEAEPEPGQIQSS